MNEYYSTRMVILIDSPYVKHPKPYHFSCKLFINTFAERNLETDRWFKSSRIHSNRIKMQSADYGWYCITN